MSHQPLERASNLKNLGRKSRRRLETVGVRSLEDLRTLGVMETYQRLRMAGFKFSTVGLYALEGALTGMHWNAIGQERKLELRIMAYTVRTQLKFEAMS